MQESIKNRISMSLLTHLLLFFLLFSLCNCADRLGEFCNKDNNLTSGQTLADIDHVLAELVAKAPFSGFATASYGNEKERVYGLVQCREDVSKQDCQKCTADAANQTRQLCANQAEARIWFDFCFLRYGTQNFIGELDTGFGIFYWNVENVTDPEAFDMKLGALMDRVRAQAVVPANRGLGKEKTNLSPFVILYGLVQCTGDLPQLSCAQCFAIAISNFPKFCQYKKGCRVLYSSCYVRYELYPFFFPLDSGESVVGVSSWAAVYP
ncbi:cysteine-rich repeat secretory protein 55-like [Tasmannia lanceolata]|uniref:cysteine-rich repeat secretory protein 55-like n=1 Tax=Tasmannia lanceolata TaxID=3420 RepID=UPI004062B5BA